MPGVSGHRSACQDRNNNALESSLYSFFLFPFGDKYETPKHLFTFSFRKLIKHLQGQPLQGVRKGPDFKINLALRKETRRQQRSAAVCREPGSFTAGVKGGAWVCGSSTGAPRQLGQKGRSRPASCEGWGQLDAPPRPPFWRVWQSLHSHQLEMTFLCTKAAQISLLLKYGRSTPASIVIGWRSIFKGNPLV